MRIIDPDESEEEVEVRRSRGRPNASLQSRTQRIVDPDESEEEVQPRPRPRGRPSRTSESTRSTAARHRRTTNESVEEEAEARRPRGRPSRTSTPIEVIEEEEPVARQRPRSRPVQTFSQSAQAAAPTRQRHRRRIETIEEEDDEANETTIRPSRRHHGRNRGNDDEEEIEEQPTQSNKSDSLSDAVLAVFALSSKGPIKEADLKPLLGRFRYKDWEDGLHELNKSLSKAFGFTLVYDGPAHSFFLRNDLFEIKSELSEMFEHGTLKKARIDDGTISKRSKPFTQDEFNDDDKKGLLFTILSSIMMSNNVEMGHKHWGVEEEVLKHMCEIMGISDTLFEKLLSGKTAEFIKEGWLRKKEELIGDNNYLYHYSWGPRAVGTISTLKVFEKFCMINQTPELEWGNYGAILKKLDEKNDLYNPR
uniref:MAGE domain-containing protein n=1 Tax=Panagrolaimus sp. PS1159 TaxID=55785 RepID=A0AC35EX61_9BILA